jgi:hypothetical protein
MRYPMEILEDIKNNLVEDLPFEEIELDWWGYVHKEGTLQAKRYFGAEDINEAHESPFCIFVHGPFKAKNRDQALDIVKNAALESGAILR